MVIHVNALPVERGWGTSSECAAKTMPLTRVYNEAGANLLCAFGGPVTIRRDAGAPRFWLQALDAARQQNLSLPEHWLMSGFRISDRHDIVEVHYHYLAPAASPVEAQSGSPSGIIAASWSGLDGTVAAQARGQPWLSSMTVWSEAMKDQIEQGFKGRLATWDVGPPLPSERKAPSDPGPTATVRGSPDATISQLHKSVLKMLSWKVIGISAGLTIKYLFIGDIMMAAGLQVATTTVTGILFVGYDMLWASAFPDSHRAVVDFTSVTVSS